MFGNWVPFAGGVVSVSSLLSSFVRSFFTNAVSSATGESVSHKVFRNAAVAVFCLVFC